MNYNILTAEVQEFIRNFSEDTSKLALTGSPFNGLTVKDLIIQIESRRKSEKKLPLWFNTKGIYFPPKLNLEQTSSQKTASYKATILQGNRLADITGGFGVDTVFFSEKFITVDYFEKNETLAEIAQFNFKKLKKKNITIHKADALSNLDNNYDVIYVDPSRRDDIKGKVYYLTDCHPNIPKHLERLFNIAETILIKTSPMLDISVGLSELKNVSEVHVVAVNNEVKELLWLLKKDFSAYPKVKTINLRNDENETFDFTWQQPFEAIYGNPERFLYEPNAAILKSGAFHLLAEAYKVRKLHKHTHLYTSEALREFPGRIFIIESIIPYNKKNLKDLALKKANITTRNFPESVAQLRKKYKIKDGGEIYLFFSTLEDEQKTVLVCKKL